MRVSPASIVVGISAALLLATGVLWVRSYAFEDEIDYTSVRTFAAISRVGTLHLAVKARWEQPAGPGGEPKPEHLAAIAPQGWTTSSSRLLPDDAGLIDDRWFHYQEETIALQSPAWHLVWDGEHKTASTGLGYRVVQADLPIPYLVLLAVFAALPVRYACQRIKIRRRIRSGRCWRCGYDVRATPGHCPECGTAARSK